MQAHDGESSKSCNETGEISHMDECCSGYTSHCASTLTGCSTALRYVQQILLRHLRFEMVLLNKHIFAYEPPPPKS